MKKLPHVDAEPGRTRLSKDVDIFQIAISTELANGYEFKDMTQRHLKEFHAFLRDTVYKGLSISLVEKAFLRTKGMSSAPPVYHNGHELLHFGKADKPFRIFRYYDKNGYFVICRIDGDHQTHRE